MSDAIKTPEAPAEPLPAADGKLSNRDPSLLLERPPRINKKFIKVTMIAFAGVFMIAVIMAYQPRKERSAKSGAGVDEDGNVIIRRPGDLIVTAEDYLPRSYEEEAAPAEGEPSPSTASISRWNGEKPSA